MRISYSLFALALASCSATAVHEGTPYVAMLDPSAPYGTALADVDSHAFVPLADVTQPRWTGSGDAAEALVRRGVARYVEPVQQYKLDFVPADPRLKDQWALADIDAPKAWDLAPSAKGVVVAVIDSGVQLGHPDLQNAIWTNEGEVPGNGLDDDDNGFVDDVHGWDFVDNDADPTPPLNDEYSNHGTHVAGIIGAVSDNGKGIAGVAPDVLIMPVRTMDGQSGSTATIADGIDYAVKNGADVINLSLGGAYSRVLDEAIARAWKAGVVVVAAAGNDGAPEASFPASSKVAGVLGVSATDKNDQLTSFSNYGPGVDISAPGLNILSTFGPKSYKLLSGTSMAAPHVAGAMALRIASRKGKHDKSFAAMLASLPAGPDGVPRLDLAAMVEPSAKTPKHKVKSHRARVAFHAASAHRPPPPQTVELDAVADTEFDVNTDAWVHPGDCRSAPCKLTVTVDPSTLGYGLHSTTLVLQPKDGSEATDIGIDVFVGSSDDSTLSLESVSDGTSTPVGDALTVAEGTPVVLRAVREGRCTRVHWTVDDTETTGRELQGVFPRPGSYKVRAADDAGHELMLPVVVTAGGAGAATGVGVSHGG